MCTRAPSASAGRSRNGAGFVVRWAVTWKLPTPPGPVPPRGPDGEAARPLFWIWVPGASSVKPWYGWTTSPATLIAGMLSRACIGVPSLGIGPLGVGVGVAVGVVVVVGLGVAVEAVGVVEVVDVVDAG